MTVMHQSVGFFDDPAANDRSLLPLQVGSISDPALPTMEQATGLLSPDHATESRMSHFDPSLYDLRPESHLVRFMKVILGDAGAGQLRKRYTVARLQATLGGTHFYDLDGFYGAIFGAQRRVEEMLPVNPMTSTATPDEWDDIEARDAKFRERVAALAKALPMAGTVEGLRQAAEALTGVECDVYETWRLLESGASAYAGRTWDDVEADFADWDAMEGLTWTEITAAVSIGRAGVSNPDEVYVRPKRDYNPADSSEASFREAERQRLEDEMAVQRVLNMLKPAGVLLTVDNRGMALHIPTTIGSIEADSNFWQVLTKVAARPGLGHAANPYPVSPVKASLGIVQDGTLQPLPVVPFHNAQTHQWTYNSVVTSVAAYALRDSSPTVTATGGAVVDKRNWEKVPATVAGPATEYRPGSGLTDQRALAAAQAAADSVLQAHPYSGPRVKVETHG